MSVPVGFDGIVKAYGDPRPYIRHDGTLAPEWERHTLKTCELPDTIPLGWEPTVKIERIRCHFALIPHFRAAFDGIKANGLWGELHTFDGCYAPRAQRGDHDKLSTHAWGIAIDLNAGTNQRGTPGDMHPGLIQCFEACGFTWGGRFDTPDPMHFQHARGY